MASRDSSMCSFVLIGSVWDLFLLGDPEMMVLVVVHLQNCSIMDGFLNRGSCRRSLYCWWWSEPVSHLFSFVFLEDWSPCKWLPERVPLKCGPWSPCVCGVTAQTLSSTTKRWGLSYCRRWPEYCMTIWWAWGMERDLMGKAVEIDHGWLSCPPTWSGIACLACFHGLQQYSVCRLYWSRQTSASSSKCPELASTVVLFDLVKGI